MLGRKDDDDVTQPTLERNPPHHETPEHDANSNNMHQQREAVVASNHQQQQEEQQNQQTSASTMSDEAEASGDDGTLSVGNSTVSSLSTLLSSGHHPPPPSVPPQHLSANRGMYSYGNHPPQYRSQSFYHQMTSLGGMAAAPSPRSTTIHRLHRSMPPSASASTTTTTTFSQPSVYSHADAARAHRRSQLRSWNPSQDFYSPRSRVVHHLPSVHPSATPSPSASPSGIRFMPPPAMMPPPVTLEPSMAAPTTPSHVNSVRPPPYYTTNPYHATVTDFRTNAVTSPQRMDGPPSVVIHQLRQERQQDEANSNGPDIVVETDSTEDDDDSSSTSSSSCTTSCESSSFNDRPAAATDIPDGNDHKSKVSRGEQDAEESSVALRDAPTTPEDDASLEGEVPLRSADTTASAADSNRVPSVPTPPLLPANKATKHLSTLDQQQCCVAPSTTSSSDTVPTSCCRSNNDGNMDSSNNSGRIMVDTTTHEGSPDSKYPTYTCLVDSQQHDRSVEIQLNSWKRPHMRAFHFAWMGFFVAFFTWFAITPLLSEVQASLDLTKEQIWTSNTYAVAGSAVTRILIGPFCDSYGARLSMSATLILSSIPTMLTGTVQTAGGLYALRLLIGVAGSAFVTCQYWTSSMFTREVVGTANALVAGWGNLGGGVTQVVMGSVLFPLFKIIYSSTTNADHERASDLAWRTVCVIPGLMGLGMGYLVFSYSDDSPKGNHHKRKRTRKGTTAGTVSSESSTATDLDVPVFRHMYRAAQNYNTWILFVQYGCCFGVEITMVNAAALYFKEEFGQSTESAAAIASIFGWMNLFARGVGGFCSDMANATPGCGMRGRLIVQVLTLVLEGALVLVFAVTDTLVGAIFVMMVFSFFVQAAEGSTFGIVPYVNPESTGSISGIVGAGGNVGGVLFAIMFREFDYRTAFRVMGFVVMASASLTIPFRISGYAGLLLGRDDDALVLSASSHNRPAIHPTTSSIASPAIVGRPTTAAAIVVENEDDELAFGTTSVVPPSTTARLSSPATRRENNIKQQHLMEKTDSIVEELRHEEASSITHEV